jgi:superfamily II DNA or RNA helicase
VLHGVSMSKWFQCMHTCMCMQKMLGEGYSNVNLSCVAIVRPMLSLNVFSQLVGRATRRCADANANQVDQEATIVSHSILGIRPLWVAYKAQSATRQQQQQQHPHVPHGRGKRAVYWACIMLFDPHLPPRFQTRSHTETNQLRPITTFWTKL